MSFRATIHSIHQVKQEPLTYDKVLINQFSILCKKNNIPCIEYYHDDNVIYYEIHKASLIEFFNNNIDIKPELRKLISICLEKCDQNNDYIYIETY